MLLLPTVTACLAVKPKDRVIVEAMNTTTMVAMVLFGVVEAISDFIKFNNNVKITIYSARTKKMHKIERENIFSLIPPADL